ncbi:MAG: polyprenyl synthetase family protein [Gemmatimonadetes bacterium]|jgi:geranylgeranyl pyrophosphate synthase|nr:polyprenyl synthetase family protein [Gemmatimonadota bacterium]MBT6148991.1 polyprenyl synthetase family protein [Gemmatimonadota bacterium]
MSAVPPQLRGFLEKTIPLIETELFSFLPIQEPEEFMYRPMRDYPERGGKRSRPALVLLSCEALGGDLNRALRTAAAFEMFQSFALLHDDIEDDSEMRRGKPCCHRTLGVPLSINVGDALYAKVFEVLAANREILGSEMTVDLIDEMIRGSRETFEGQAYDVGWIRGRHIPSEDEFMTMLRKKTGWYTGRGPCTAGAIIAGASQEDRRRIGEFGETMAIGFQIRDDLLNLTAAETDAKLAPGITSGAYGKERGGDIAEGKRTLIIIDLLRKCTPAEKDEVLQILHADREHTSAEQIERVIDLVEHYDAMAYPEELARKWGERSQQHLEQLPATDARDRLHEMLDFFVQRAF